MNQESQGAGNSEPRMRLAFRAGMLTLGLQFAAGGMVYDGGRQLLSVIIGLLVAVASFTSLAVRFSDSAVRDRSERYMRIGAILLPALMLVISLIIPATLLFSSLQGMEMGQNQKISLVLYLLGGLISLAILVRHLANAAGENS